MSACACTACALGVTDERATACERFQGCRTPVDAIEEMVATWHKRNAGLASYDPRAVLVDLLAAGLIAEGYIERSGIDWTYEIYDSLRAIESAACECESCRGAGCGDCDLTGVDATSVGRVIDCSGVARCPRCAARADGDDAEICACGVWLRRSLERALALSVRGPANDQPIAAE